MSSYDRTDLKYAIMEWMMTGDTVIIYRHQRCGVAAAGTITSRIWFDRRGFHDAPLKRGSIMQCLTCHWDIGYRARFIDPIRYTASELDFL